MGFRLAWVAIKGVPADEACDIMGLERLGGGQPYPDFEFSGAELPTGWYLGYGGPDEGYAYLGYNDMAAFSRKHDVVLCEVEEHVMYFSVAYWSGGKCLWRTVHDSDKGECHLDAEGDLPAEYESIRAEYFRQQEEEGDADYVAEIPTELARAVVGYKHDERDIGDVTLSFEELAVREGVEWPKPRWPEKPPSLISRLLDRLLR